MQAVTVDIGDDGAVKLRRDGVFGGEKAKAEEITRWVQAASERSQQPGGKALILRNSHRSFSSDEGAEFQRVIGSSSDLLQSWCYVLLK